MLAALVNEIMASPDLCREVDIRMEQIASFRREKWKINLKLKRWALYETAVVFYICWFRFRSKLSSEYGIGAKKKPIVYCGRGRPPKKALMNVGTDGQVIYIEFRKVFVMIVVLTGGRRRREQWRGRGRPWRSGGGRETR